MKFLSCFAVLLVFLIVPAVAFDQVFFSPNGGCQKEIITDLRQAQTSVDIAMFAFTSRPIAQTLLNLQARGVKVRILLDKAQAKQEFSKGRYFSQQGIEVRYATGSGLMHNKFAVIDGALVITGSYNWTAAAETKNAENLLVVDNDDIIAKYAERFDLLWANGVSQLPAPAAKTGKEE